MVNSALIYDERGRAALETICRQYIEVGRKKGAEALMIAIPKAWHGSSLP